MFFSGCTGIIVHKLLSWQNMRKSIALCFTSPLQQSQGYETFGRRIPASWDKTPHCSHMQLRATPANRGPTSSFSFQGCCCHYSIHHWHMPWHERTCWTCVRNLNWPKMLVTSTELQGTTRTDHADGTGKWDRFLYNFIWIHTLLLVAKAGSMALHIRNFDHRILNCFMQLCYDPYLSLYTVLHFTLTVCADPAPFLC